MKGCFLVGFERHCWYCSVVQSCPTATPWTAAHQVSLSFTFSWSLLRLLSIELVMPSEPFCALLSLSPPAFNLCQPQGLFQWVGSLHQVARVLELQLQHQSFQWIFRVDFLWDWLVWSPCSPKDSQESSPTSQFKSINSLVLSLLYGPTHMWLLEKPIALTIRTFVRKVITLLFNMLSRFVILFFLRSKHLLISQLQSPSTVILEAKKIKSVSASIVSPFICHELMEPDAMSLVFWMLSFKPTFSLSSFTFIKRLFSSLLSAIRVVSSAYLRHIERCGLKNKWICKIFTLYE